MNIVTIDMVENNNNNNHGSGGIDQQSEECKGCPDCNSLDSNYDGAFRVMNAAPTVQQQTTSLNPQTATVCSCSGCMASQTAY